MTTVSPQGSVYFCQTPLEADYKNQLTFANQTAQSTYFASTVVHTFTDNTYIRKDGGIKVNCNVETLRQCNYLYYKNTGFDTRTIYCFITSMEYLSEDSTLVRFETDCFQTWYFSLLYKPCFVEREHVANDAVGANTVPEGLQTGEYISNNLMNVTPNPADIDWSPATGYTYQGKEYLIAFQVTELTDDIYSVANIAQNYNGIYSGLFILGVDNATDALNLIRGYANEGKSDAIVSCFLSYPHFFNAGFLQTISHKDGKNFSVNRLYSARTGDWATILKSSVTLGTGFNFATLDGYTPKNNKLKTYPFCYYLVDNNAGQTNVFRNEFFARTTQYPNPTFTLYGAIGQGNSTKLVPKNYAGVVTQAGNYQEGVQGAKLPICAYKTDYYLNWATQNAINMTAGGVSSVISGAVSGGMSGMAGGVIGAAVGAGVGATTSGLLAVMNILAKDETAKLMPDQAKGNLNVSDLNIGFYGNVAGSGALFTIKAMSVRAEYARIIDDFFNMFGYKVNRVKVPQFSSRTYWNYVKTVDCNVEGNIPQEDLQTIRNMFNKGCTFWHGATNMYNYNLTNSIVS